MIDKLRLHLPDTAFARRHRKRLADFIRERVLTFPVLLLLLLQKSLKSLQAHVHEFFWQWPGPAVSAGALTHARGKLCASAFGELNALVLQTVYQDAAHAPFVQRWRGHRLLGVDSSLVRLPDHASLRRSFGVVECSNHHGAAGSHPEGRVSVLYDLGNQLALDTVLVGSRTAETQLAAGHLTHVQKDDVLITDRGYSGYRWFVQVRAADAHFVARCSRGSFAAVQALFARDEAGVSQVVTLAAPQALRTRCREEHWPLALPVRLVTVRLPGGELEVLATSLLEEARCPSAELAGVYWRRWGQETFYARLKERLDLEHFSGQTPEAVAQDFAALVLLSNVESVVIGPAQEQLAAVSARQEQAVQVNRAVSLHALKVRLIELLASSVPTEQVLAELTEWLVRSPVSVRPGRAVPRRRPSPLRSYHYEGNHHSVFRPVQSRQRRRNARDPAQRGYSPHGRPGNARCELLRLGGPQDAKHGQAGPVDDQTFSTTPPQGYEVRSAELQSRAKCKINAGDKVPDFALPDLNGREVTLASLKGKVVLLDFWAPGVGLASRR